MGKRHAGQAQAQNSNKSKRRNNNVKAVLRAGAAGGGTSKADAGLPDYFKRRREADQAKARQREAALVSEGSRAKAERGMDVDVHAHVLADAQRQDGTTGLAMEEDTSVRDSLAESLSALQASSSSSSRVDRPSPIDPLISTPLQRLAASASSSSSISAYAPQEEMRRDAALSGKKDNSSKAYMKELRRVIELSDVLIEVLDARDPLACR